MQNLADVKNTGRMSELKSLCTGKTVSGAQTIINSEEKHDTFLAARAIQDSQINKESVYDREEEQVHPNLTRHMQVQRL